MRKRKSTQPSENVSPGGGKSSAGSDTIHAKKIRFGHQMRAFLRIFCLVSNIFQAAIHNTGELTKKFNRVFEFIVDGLLLE